MQLVKAMNLSVRERLLMGSFFPQKGTIRDMRIVKDIARKLILTEEEKVEIEFIQDKEGIRWNGQKAQEKAIDLNDDEREFLKRQVNRLDEEAAYDMDLYDLAERIKEL